MKMTIKEIKERGEKDDQVKFKAKVKNVYDAKELTPEQKAKAKWTKTRQNVVVEDKTDSIQVIISHKELKDEFKQDIVGEEIRVDGKVTLWEGKTKIFGKLIFKPREDSRKKDTSTTVKPSTISVLPAGVEIRKIALKDAIEFWNARIGDKMEENKILTTANIFNNYLLGKFRPGKSTQGEGQKEEGPKESKDTKTEKQVVKVDNVPLINEIMQLKEDQELDTETFAKYCNGKDIKTLPVKELEEIKKKLEGITQDIPF